MWPLRLNLSRVKPVGQGRFQCGARLFQPSEEPSMFLKAVVLTLALVAVTGAWAEVNADQVATVVWDYFSQLSNSAKEAVEHLQKSELTQKLNTLFQDKLEEVNTYRTDLQKRLVPFATALHERLTKDSEKLKEEIRKELEELRARLLPHADEGSQKIGDNMRELERPVFGCPPAAEEETLRNRLEGDCDTETPSTVCASPLQAFEVIKSSGEGEEVTEGETGTKRGD
nr:PREDICTED: apolipoprotein A-IV [Equus przewalskii]